MRLIALAIVMTILAAGLFVSSCQTAPPDWREQADLCDIFDDRKNWYRAAAEAERDWGTPIALQMAIMQAESSFDSDARPARNRIFFGLIPAGRPTSAYGYAQAVNSTWETYKRASGNNGAERDDFDDAADFIAWYARETRRQAGVPFSDGRGHSLAYHQGWNGYLSGRWRGNDWLVRKSASVGETAARYDRQLDRCENSLKRNWIPFF